MINENDTRIPPLLIRDPSTQPLAKPPRPPSNYGTRDNMRGPWAVKPFDPINGDPRLPYHPRFNPNGYIRRPPGWSVQNPNFARPPLPYQPDWPGWGGGDYSIYPWIDDFIEQGGFGPDTPPPQVID